MKKILLIIFVVLIPIWFLFYTNLSPVFSDELDEINKEIAELQQALDASKKATVPLESQLNNLTTRLDNIQARVSAIEAELEVKRESIAKGYLELGEQQESFNLIVKNSYIKTYSLSPLLLFFSSDDPGEFIKFLTYQKQDAERDKSEITSTALKLVDLEERKTKLEGEEKTLANVKATLDKERAEVAKIVDGAKNYQSELSGKIATLTARQNEIINARSGGFTATIGDSELADDYNASIKGFRESAPSGYFGVFSFGAYTHRNGMSQYGALGHVKSQNWNYEQILKHYYPGVNISDVDTNNTIIVNGTNSYGQVFNNESFNFEDYLKHIYEVPSSWPEEILKAQAIAARSYAYGKGTICPGQGCQEFKREENSDAWKAAVEATRGKVMTGGPGNWQYSSTTGGWINGLGWDTTDGQGGGNFVDKSYEKIAGSPWVYKAWYTETYRNDSDKCGRSNAWLSPEEMADIVNAAIALKTDGIDTKRITPVTTSCWGGNPYSMDELRNLVSGKGGISSATSVSVSQGNGTTNNVTINGVSLNGDEFKKAFNLRAPGRLSIPQSGFAFFNIEKK